MSQKYLTDSYPSAKNHTVVILTNKLYKYNELLNKKQALLKV